MTLVPRFLKEKNIKFGLNITQTRKGIAIYTKTIKKYSKDKGIIIATNREKDIVFDETEVIELI